VHLAVGTIVACDEVPTSDKLYRLQIDFGYQGKRQILAGIKKSYAVNELMGKQVTCVINLKPRMMLGFESQGMVLAAQDEKGKTQLVSPFASVPNGTRLK
jgi:methionine--tRNA ligase beta chain